MIIYDDENVPQKIATALKEDLAEHYGIRASEYL
jgi:hypothetical protein